MSARLSAHLKSNFDSEHESDEQKQKNSHRGSFSKNRGYVLNDDCNEYVTKPKKTQNFATELYIPPQDDNSMYYLSRQDMKDQRSKNNSKSQQARLTAQLLDDEYKRSMTPTKMSRNSSTRSKQGNSSGKRDQNSFEKKLSNRFGNSASSSKFEISPKVSVDEKFMMASKQKIQSHKRKRSIDKPPRNFSAERSENDKGDTVEKQKPKKKTITSYLLDSEEYSSCRSISEQLKSNQNDSEKYKLLQPREFDLENEVKLSKSKFRTKETEIINDSLLISRQTQNKHQKLTFERATPLIIEPGNNSKVRYLETKILGDSNEIVADLASKQNYIYNSNTKYERNSKKEDNDSNQKKPPKSPFDVQKSHQVSRAKYDNDVHREHSNSSRIDSKTQSRYEPFQIASERANNRNSTTHQNMDSVPDFARTYQDSWRTEGNYDSRQYSRENSSERNLARKSRNDTLYQRDSADPYRSLSTENHESRVSYKKCRALLETEPSFSHKKSSINYNDSERYEIGAQNFENRQSYREQLETSLAKKEFGTMLNNRSDDEIIHKSNIGSKKIHEKYQNDLIKNEDTKPNHGNTLQSKINQQDRNYDKLYDKSEEYSKNKPKNSSGCLSSEKLDLENKNINQRNSRNGKHNFEENSNACNFAEKDYNQPASKYQFEHNTKERSEILNEKPFYREHYEEIRREIEESRKIAQKYINRQYTPERIEKEDYNKNSKYFNDFVVSKERTNSILRRDSSIEKRYNSNDEYKKSYQDESKNIQEYGTQLSASKYKDLDRKPSIDEPPRKRYQEIMEKYRNQSPYKHDYEHQENIVRKYHNADFPSKYENEKRSDSVEKRENKFKKVKEEIEFLRTSYKLSNNTENEHKYSSKFDHDIQTNSKVEKQQRNSSEIESIQSRYRSNQCNELQQKDLNRGNYSSNYSQTIKDYRQRDSKYDSRLQKENKYHHSENEDDNRNFMKHEVKHSYSKDYLEPKELPSKSLQGLEFNFLSAQTQHLQTEDIEKRYNKKLDVEYSSYFQKAKEDHVTKPEYEPQSNSPLRERITNSQLLNEQNRNYKLVMDRPINHNTNQIKSENYNSSKSSRNRYQTSGSDKPIREVSYEQSKFLF